MLFAILSEKIFIVGLVVLFLTASFKGLVALFLTASLKGNSPGTIFFGETQFGFLENYILTIFCDMMFLSVLSEQSLIVFGSKFDVAKV